MRGKGEIAGSPAILGGLTDPLLVRDQRIHALVGLGRVMTHAEPLGRAGSS